MDLSQISQSWAMCPDGIWRASRTDAISYPESGNDSCFAYEEASFWFRHRNRIILSLVQNFAPKGPFFDVGGGNGFVTKALQDASVPAVLVEPGPSGCINARSRGVEFAVQSMWNPDIIDGAVADSIGLFDVVEHIEDDFQFLQGVHQTLKAHGHVFISVPAFRLLWSDEDVQAGHFRRYSRRRLTRLLTATGFDTLYCSYFFVPLLLPILLFRTLPAFVGLRKDANQEVHAKEHAQRRGFLGSTIDKSLDWELSRISRLKTVPLGSSCMIVGKKRSG